MTKGYSRGLARGRALTQQIRRLTLPIRNVALTVNGATGVGFGSAVIGDVPDGNILLLGAVSYLQFQGPTSASLVDTYDGDYGIGSTPADDATITNGDVDIIQSTALGAATAELSPNARGTSAAATAGVILDNTDGSLELNLNLLIDDANISGDGIVMTANGTLTLSYILLGDD